MMMQKVMEKRRSVREYKHKELENKDIEALRGFVEKTPKIATDAEVRFHFVRDGDHAYKALSGIAGYGGVMIEAPHYLVILASQHTDCYKAAGYLTEWLVLQLTHLEVGTCWIHTNKNEEKIKTILKLETTDEVVGLLAVGYASHDPRLSNIYDTMKVGSVSSLTSLGYPHVDIGYNAEPISGRLSIKDLVYLKEWGQCLEIEELEQRGLAEVLFYMRLAPSWGNQQPWRFILDRNSIFLVVKKEYGANDSRVTDIDAGIGMLYFETAMHCDGLSGKWRFDDMDNQIVIPDDYYVAGIYTY